VSTNYFFVSSPLHLLFSSNLALRHDSDHNSIVLMPRENRQFSPFAEILAQDTSIFDEVISFETGNRRGKFAERRRRMAELRDALRKRPADRIFTGTDRRVEFQYAMSVASRLNPDVTGIYVDDGMASYLGHKSMRNLAHRYIDPLFKKLAYGWWWKNPLIIGCSAWISEAHVAYPDFVHELLKAKKVVAIDREIFKDPRFIELCRRLLQFRNVDDRSLRDIDVVIVLTHESFYPDADAHLKSLVDAVLQHDPSLRIAVKVHPRSEKAGTYAAMFPDVLFLDSKVSMELYLPLLKEQSVIIGDISSALFTANWFNESTRIVAVRLADAVPAHLEDNLVGLFRQLGIPQTDIEKLPEQLAGLRQ
jgi:hypothetical protein